MIYGLIPVGGKGTRLGLPYSKEMIPQKNFDFFNPVINHLVEKMEMAGATTIYFIHGHELKEDISKYYNEEKYVHVLQKQLGFANVLHDFYESADLKHSDKVLFGLPDSVFDKNPFVEMLLYSGIVCGLFTTDQNSKVDRLDSTESNFQVKVSKNESNQDLFWGVLKFDGVDIFKIIENKDLDDTTEIGNIINRYPKKFVKGESYLDLGTWPNYNRYLSDSHSFSNTEIEKKFNGNKVNVTDFLDFFNSYESASGRYEHIVSTDFYFTNTNPNIEFIRYREGTKNTTAVPDITIKNFKTSQLNRFELVIPLGLTNDRTQDVLHFLSLMNATFEFSVTKDCHIFYYPDFTVVMYMFDLDKTQFKMIEIELNKPDFNLISVVENAMLNIPGFDPNNTISISKFQIIKNQLKNDTTY